MSDLVLLPSVPQRRKPNRYALYLNAFHRELKAAIALGDNEKRAGKLALYGMRMLRHEKASEEKTLEWLIDQFGSYQYIMNCMSLLTPKQFLEIFPVTKEYRGARHGWKDYFSVMEDMKEYDFDAPIGEPVSGFLWDCLNGEISLFLSEMLCIISDIRRAYGEKGLLEEFFGTPAYYERTDPVTGQTYMQNNATGETFPVKKSIPRYLRPVDVEE